MTGVQTCALPIYQRDFVDVIDGWIHTINASYWKRVPDKDDVILELLHRY